MNINFNKNKEGLVPAIIQDANTQKVLMLGFMNEKAYEKTIATKKVTFYSRTKDRLWTKGEESNHFLDLVSIKNDCDHDTLLVQVIPNGPVCHKETDTCWGEENTNSLSFITVLENIIEKRFWKREPKKSYIASLFEKGINKIAQKVGEEAVEVVIEAKDHNDSLFLNESADLLFHYLILLKAKGFKLADVIKVLENRQNQK
ncbi:bifunctional phosphoribosyl-AMP cyclohydrolase/phosphoribosyl-ATP diphosphatase HisIE [Tenacibaculum maritimum]|uniref:bifunctional phosphoribosyl-AMP cyclohydrolase/phosphoribosyl-ATP diphosphatase HisIE n=1 Tax=Tenacibaculum maritimum TaxID=107401 RepID=UPI0012E551C6|nr:bifunctional phosphoribosyl-AMP cyclohydrolase/phosphoribosyl-ATP diphosphatase HisIE [Tenacibaculum maritimum]CAA0148140.1 fused phosphoribosyl-AMP cyclohydrolase; phosphoribosyl-ATP pyrophosphatase [Tenacibaculum maritimum]CAA0171833.1 fused phosphoribosyl-AMP cyclohydrolase; phosphoribosyl-ATP pyrophosphatase [Tenacibaculum maritimum]CAA0185419.1 fused phosphoribosyl-AMP cyclohydrolase; phosphoribosyl-ATP pyrophosphatase [Tenacibaculum maritimum]CAA0200260.1 fused phosphoribosyl-AMP cyclo